MTIDEALHRRLLARDPQVLDDLVAAYGGYIDQLARVILGGLGTAEDAEEIASDALVSAWERAAQYEPTRTPLKTWLLMLTKYAALDRRRLLQRRRFTSQGDEKVIPLEAAPEQVDALTPEESLLRFDRQAQLRRALHRLPEAERDLLLRRYYMDEPVTELMAALGLSRGALDNRLWRARQAMKALLQDELEGHIHGKSAI